MADYSAQFVPPLVKAMHNAAGLVGTDVLYSERSQYLAILEILSIQAMTLKLIQDLAPQVTDAILADRLNAALDTGPNGAKDWPGWVMLQVPPESLAQYGATEADSPQVLQQKIDAHNGGV